MNPASRVTDAAVVIVDISGYTRFVQQRTVSLQHAEAIVTELMEAILDRAATPLVVNKLEGDAALLYMESRSDRRPVAAAVLAQVAAFFEAFSGSLARIADTRRHCSCGACANIGSLQLKAFLHFGEIIVKRVRQFEEIAGEAVIMVHRMTKNSLPSHRYVLMTEAFHRESDGCLGEVGMLQEIIDGVPAALRWCEVEALHAGVAAAPVSGMPDLVPAPLIPVRRVHRYRHLPGGLRDRIGVTWWKRLLRSR